MTTSMRHSVAHGQATRKRSGTTTRWKRSLSTARSTPNSRHELRRPRAPHRRAGTWVAGNSPQDRQDGRSHGLLPEGNRRCLWHDRPQRGPDAQRHEALERAMELDHNGWMDWSHVTATQNDDAFFEDFVRLALACEPAKLPEQLQRLGSVAAGWFPTLPGTAHIFADGGTPLDRAFAWQVIATQLEGHGIKPASYSLDWDLADETLIKEAGWPDIQAKATRLIKSGKVKITGNAADIVTGV